ncbi:unnamed protein product [Adineta steineri]|uniref:Uncharacterized protein n=1 Tax=Adineta steineri TaxID=433720 RepID=A0A815IU13_9BILA|nr:unnamed protein product [Adineta steineri]CAF1603578.1 unnamed protein product [Adineta steineri]
MASSSSDLLSATATTTASCFPIQAVCADEDVQRALLCRHFMFLDDAVFFYLAQSGLLNKIVNVFQAKDCKLNGSNQINGQKRCHEDIDGVYDTDNNSSDSEELPRKKTKRIRITLVDISTQTDDSSIMTLSSPSSLDSILSTTTKTKAIVAQAVDVDAAREKRRYQLRLLAFHTISLHKSDFALLDHHGLLDPLVQIIEDVERTGAITPYLQSFDKKDSVDSIEVHEKHGICEGLEEEDDDDDENEDDEGGDIDYQLEMLREAEDDDEEVEIEQNESSSMERIFQE